MFLNLEAVEKDSPSLRQSSHSTTFKSNNKYNNILQNELITSGNKDTISPKGDNSCFNL